MGPGTSWKPGQCQRRGSLCGLRTSRGPSLPGSMRQAGELKGGPTPGCDVQSQALSPQGARGSTSPGRLGQAGLRAVAWGAQAGPLPGVGKVIYASSWGPGHREQTHLSRGRSGCCLFGSEFLLTATTLDLLPRPPACK